MKNFLKSTVAFFTSPSVEPWVPIAVDADPFEGMTPAEKRKARAADKKAVAVASASAKAKADAAMVAVAMAAGSKHIARLRSAYAAAAQTFGAATATNTNTCVAYAAGLAERFGPDWDLAAAGEPEARFANLAPLVDAERKALRSLFTGKGADMPWSRAKAQQRKAREWAEAVEAAGTEEAAKEAAKAARADIGKRLVRDLTKSYVAFITADNAKAEVPITPETREAARHLGLALIAMGVDLLPLNLSK